jgi:hypothetical protein
MNTSQTPFRKLAKTAYLLGSILLMTGLLFGTFATPAVANTAIAAADQAGQCPSGWSSKNESCENGCSISENQVIASVGVKSGLAGCTEFSAPDTLPGSKTDGCYLVEWSADGMTVTFSRIGSGPTCQEISYGVTYLGAIKPTIEPTQDPITPTKTKTQVCPIKTPVDPTTTPGCPTKTPVTPTSTKVTPSKTPVDTTTPGPSDTPTPEDTSTPDPSDTPTPEDTTTPGPSDTPTPEDTTTPGPSDTPTPEDTTTPGPSDTPTPEDTTTPDPSDTPIVTETVVETVIGTPVTTETPEQQDTVVAPATLEVPLSTNSGILIPVTGGDFSQNSPLAAIQLLFVYLGLSVLGMGLVLQGFSRRH